MSSDTDFNYKLAAKAQEKYCEEHGYPMFAPRDGLCYYCGRNIFMPTNGRNGAVYGITVTEAGSKLITGCPHCNHSHMD